MGKIGINIDVFNDNVTSIKAASSSISFSAKANLSKTDINPFKEYEHSIEDISNLINDYKTILESDAQQLHNIGEAIVIADKNSMGKP